MNKCSDCQGDLEKGALIDTSYGTNLVQRFAKSDNIPSDPKFLIVGNNEANFTDIRRVIAYRCIKCNRIFQYAQETVVIKDLNKRVKNLYVLIFLFPGIIFLLVLLSIFFF